MEYACTGELQIEEKIESNFIGIPQPIGTLLLLRPNQPKLTSSGILARLEFRRETVE